MAEPALTTIEPALAEILAEKLFDARTISCAEKHRLIFAGWAEIPVGDYFVLLNDHRPTPLYQQFERTVGGAFEWTELVAQPGLFAVRIERTATDPEAPDPGRLPACGGLPDDEAVLAWIEIDARRATLEEARARVLRLGGILPEWAGLVAETAFEIPTLLEELALAGKHATVERSEEGFRYRILGKPLLRL